MVIKWNCIDCGIARHPHSLDARVCAWKYDDSSHVDDSSVEYRCCLCLAHRNNTEHACTACASRWLRLQDFERKWVSSRSSDPAMLDQFLLEAEALRFEVGESLHYRLDLVMANVLLETSAGVKLLLMQAHSRRFRSVCKSGSHSVSVWSAVGKLELGVSRSAHMAAYTEDGRPVRGSRYKVIHICMSIPVGLRSADMLDLLSRTTMNPNLRMRKIAEAQGLEALVLDGNLVVLDVSGNSYLERLPVEELAAIGSLRRIECTGCARLNSPPSEISNQGGEAVVAYIKQIRKDSISNMSIELILIGNGESGKTSVKDALMSPSNKALKIHEDKRTVGMDLRTWDLREWVKVTLNVDTRIDDICGRYDMTREEFCGKNQGKGRGLVLYQGSILKCGTEVMVKSGLSFRIKDLAGQAVYHLTNQFFLVKRAIYVLVWRAVKGLRGPGDEIDQMVTSWMDAIQMRVPGARIMMVVTHIDCVTEVELERQIRHVKKVVQEKAQALRNDNRGNEFIAPLEVERGGVSFRVNCIQGTGIHELRTSLKQMAKGLPWWQELIPTSFFHFQRHIAGIAARGRNWFSWKDFENESRHLGLENMMLDICTNFMHENASIKYFGDLSGVRRDRLIDQTVFINPNWIISALKGLVRHDRDALLTYFGEVVTGRDLLGASKQTDEFAAETARKMWLRRVKRLVCYGILHDELVYFLWPCGNTELSFSFWEWVRANDEDREQSLWKSDVAQNADDYIRVLALLESFDIMHRVSDSEYIAPALLAEGQANRIDARTFEMTECHAQSHYHFANIAYGFFERLIIKCRPIYAHLDFSPNAAAFYGRGLKAHIVVLKDVLITSNGVKRKAISIRCLASTGWQIRHIESNIESLMMFFPGMRILHNDVVDQPVNLQEPIQIRILEAIPAFEASLIFPNKSWIQVASQEELKLRDKFRSTGIAWTQNDMMQSFIARPVESRGITPVDIELHNFSRDGDFVRFTFCVEKLCQDRDNIRMFEQYFEMYGARMIATFSSISLTVKEMLMDIDKVEKPEGNESLEIYAGLDDIDANRLRVVLICMDERVASNEQTLLQFEKAVNASLAIIPLICPGYEFPKKHRNGILTNEPDYSRWWPPQMPRMRDHSLFVNLSKRDEWRTVIKEALYPAIAKYLTEWRGKLPEWSIDQEHVNNIPCIVCHDENIRQPGSFSRKLCEQLMAEYRSHQNENSFTIIHAEQDTDPTLNEDSDEKDLGVKFLGEQKSDPRERNDVRKEKMPMETCGNGHELRVDNILSHSRIFQSYQCPQCLEHGQVPPYCFNRDECLLHLSESTMSSDRTGSMRCPYCDKANRPPLIRVFDIVVPEVFISYNWGVFDEDTNIYSTQRLVEPIRSRLEQNTDVVTWYDVGGGLKVGQSHMKEMEAGIRKATVVIIFLSDAYCNSENCIREYLHSVKYNKFIIPILISTEGQTTSGFPSGWTGPGSNDVEWWQHCKNISGCVNPDSDKRFSWVSLSQFTPIDLRGLDLNSSQMCAAELQIAKRVQSRFHRGGYIQHEVSVKYELLNKKALFCSFKTSFDTVEGEREATSWFEKIDTDGDGKIDRDELRRAFPQLSEDAASAFILEADENNDGKIDLKEWLHILRITFSERRTAKSCPLRLLDIKNQRSEHAQRDNSPSSRTPSGRKKLYPAPLCKEQLLSECSELGVERAGELVTEADLDKDGYLTFEELYAIIQAHA